MKLYILAIFWIFFGLYCDVIGGEVEEMYYWKDITYEDLPYKEDAYIGKYPYYIPGNNDILGLSYHTQSGLMFVAVGRLRPGIPSTLNAFCVADYDKGTSPHLWGFPDYKRNTLRASFYEESEYNRGLQNKKENYASGYYNHFYGEQGGHNYGIITHMDKQPTQDYHNFLEEFSIVSIYHPTVDDLCNRLFIVDNGNLYYGPTNIYNVQNPAIVVFDLPSNGCKSRKFPVIRRVVIPSHLWKNSVGLGFLTVDYQSKGGSCDDIFLYITNVFDNNVVVYDYKKGNFWVHEDPLMNPIVSESFMLFKHEYYQYLWGIGKVTLGWADKYGNKNAYYAPIASTGQYVVSTAVLKNSKKNSHKSSSDEFSLIGYRGCRSQAFTQVFDDTTGVIFFAEIQSKKVRCWNTQLPLNPDTIGVVYEADSLYFTSEIFIDHNGYLWFHSSQIPTLLNTNETLDTTEVNSRTFCVKASYAIKGTVCDVTTYKYM